MAELEIVSSIVEEYEYIHYPIGSDVYEEPDLTEITKTLYDLAQERRKELLSIIPKDESKKTELEIMCNVIEKYETKHTNQ